MRGVAEKINEGRVVHDALDMHAVRFEPEGDGGDVLLGQAEALAELARGDPLVILGGGGLLLAINEIFQIRLLRGSALQYEIKAERQIVFDRAEIAIGSQVGADIALERNSARVIDLLADGGGNGAGATERGLRHSGRGQWNENGEGSGQKPGEKSAHRLAPYVALWQGKRWKASGSGSVETGMGWSRTQGEPVSPRSAAWLRSCRLQA